MIEDERVNFERFSFLPCDIDWQVVKVERIENSTLWQRYANKRSEMTALEQVESLKRTGAGTGTETETERGLAAGLASAAEWQSELLLGGSGSANEVLLFHGTEAAAVEKILQDGLDPRVSSAGLFGHGLYFAENASKSDEYTGRPADGLHLMFLSRVLLGRPYAHRGFVLFR